MERKFLKHIKINVLYNFIKSLKGIFSLRMIFIISLLQTFPFKSFDDKKDNILDEEGLFPKSVLQIKEIE